MTEREQQSAFARDLKALVNRYAHEFDLSYESIFGCFEVEKATLLNELLNPELYEDQ